jgi:hypothetical protein
MSVAEERLKQQLKALQESNPTDEFVTFSIMENGELAEMTRAGWDLVTKTSASKHTFLNEYLVRRRRDELVRTLGRER